MSQDGFSFSTLEWLMHRFTDSNEFEEAMRLTRNAFIYHLSRITTRMNDDEKVANVVRGILRLEQSNNWAKWQRAYFSKAECKWANFIKYQICRLYLSNELEPETVTLIQQSTAITSHVYFHRFQKILSQTVTQLRPASVDYSYLQSMRGNQRISINQQRFDDIYENINGRQYPSLMAQISADWTPLPFNTLVTL